MDTTMTKTMLWTLLAIAVAANGLLSSQLDGVFQVLLSAVAGIVGLAAIAGLIALKRGSSA
ncbi:hypothetical protein GCM10010329_71780 [Streptomyces spiroverticillatus]|uniref:Uncharacterized protein n=1 Tax=Streptomyces finlayi TaxID=67296 RepID=A0A919CBF6_9ACTN|nr:hypothetical protein [Streptomyces finlayi]GHA38283.1 hypothetical protein GCM10010329_71780 [Streptomyces spiroverticillatus]GHD00610.1 hypothetical protein GCM10010334_45210 [Streptomyces finlayi]